ncbi:rho GTPase-activating protein 6-like isoform X3 [Etheostoma cragini]|uniref:rho GTPase-activating protein 6-like isoform X3 n=1 Tax=Etheostoma cragini TaxID=417921 RepID=UPI00155E940B|nr:rho GTPase-activating protein 6-like isoform X3 [Etheostoma cragini]
MSAHGLLSSVFSCSLSPKTISKRRLRKTKSLDPALMRHHGSASEETSYKGDFTWNSVSGRTIGLKPVPLQSLSELERVHLQHVAFRRLFRDRYLGCHITIPKYGHKHKTSLLRKLDSLSKEKSKDKEATPQAFGIPLSQVISNDRTQRQRNDPPREEHSDPTELMLSFLHLNSSFKRGNKEFSSSNSSLSSTSETPNESPLLITPGTAPRTRRRGGVSVDCITDLDDNQSRLLEALQLSLPVEAVGNRKKHHDTKLSLNPIYRQVPRVVDLCCQHLEKHGLQTVGIFRVGSSKKRVRQLRMAFDQGWEVQLDEEHSVHDVAALLKEFLRDMPAPLLTRELYMAFINTMLLDYSDQESAIQLLIFLLPPCNSDTLQRLLCLLSTVAAHAKDGLDNDGQAITGNKMTSLNLATIFGPNLLHKQKNSDKEFSVQSFARAEESTAIISVLQRMINTYDTLFMVPADLQHEVLMSVQETDPDVVDYLLRRKASHEPGLLRAGESFSLPKRCFFNDSIKVSSGEVTPYDNNSPVLSGGLLCNFPADSSSLSDRVPRPSGQYKLSGHCQDGSGSTSPTLSTDKEASTDHFWDTWHELLSKEFTGHHITGSLGDMSECESYGSSEGQSSHQGNNKLPIRPTQTSLGLVEIRPHLPVTRSSSVPHAQRGQRQPQSLHQGLSSQSGALSSGNLAERTGHPACSLLKVGMDGLSPLPYSGQLKETHISHSTSSFFTYQPDPQTPQQAPKSPAPPTVDTANASGPGHEHVPGTPNWQTERWHIWHILSKENADALPETLV